MQMKNNTSSMGRLKKYTPVRYRGENHHTPIPVNQMSQIRKIIAGMMMAGITEFSLRASGAHG